MGDLSSREKALLRAMLDCEPDKGILVAQRDKRIVSALVRKGYARTIESVFMVAIATGKARAARNTEDQP